MNPVRLAAVLAILLTTGASSVPPRGELQTPGTYSAVEVYAALAKAYPQKVKIEEVQGTTDISVDGRRFTWADGRLLPADFTGNPELFAEQPFYHYPAEEPAVDQWTDEEVSQAEARLADRRADNLKRNSEFYDSLWEIHGRGSADDHQRRVTFLGMPVTVHRDVVDPLQRVEARLVKARAQDPELDDFLDTVVRLEGYNWRAIAETRSRSNHAYGVAVDLIPKDYGPFNPYWLWVSQDKPGWYRAAWANRWKPNPAVVRAFEAEGFLWGGKWLLFDTIHFEYRPEILILNGLR